MYIPETKISENS